MLRRGSLVLLIALAACHGHPAPTTPSSAADPALAARVARLEQRLDRVITFLNQAVPPTLDEDRTYAVPIDPLDPVVGPADAKVTIIEAFEYLCPYCAVVAPTLDALAAKYPKDVRIVSKYFVIHGPPAEPPGHAACAAAKQGKFAAMQDAIWSTIWPVAGEPAHHEQAEPDALVATAAVAGLDVARFRRDVAGADCAAWLSHSAATLQRFGATGTPSFYVNGRPVSGLSTVEEFSTVVEAARAQVDKSGVPAARYYAEVVLGKGEPKAVLISPFGD